jgi:ABC-type transport system involved in multi-copper enzyme maturation permease subunit
LIVGPVFTREAVTAPRRMRFFAIRSLAVATLLGLTLTAWQILVGAHQIRNPGDLAQFGAALFQILAPLQLAVVVLFSALLTAAAVAQEKDRKTLLLLLITRLTNSELVLGKLLASLVVILATLAATTAFFMLVALIGGVSFWQIARVMAITTASALVAGSLGSTLALWREKSFQTLAMTVLSIFLWLLIWEIAAAGAMGDRLFGFASLDVAAAMSPWQAMRIAIEPDFAEHTASAPTDVVAVFLLCAAIAVAGLNGIAIALVRVWNPSREAQPRTEDDESTSIETAAIGPAVARGQQAMVHRAPGKVRPVWDNPILWREVRTWAYGKKIIAVRIAYLLIFAMCALVLENLINARNTAGARSTIPPLAQALAPLLVVSVLLVNALAVTSITNERDAKALDLLLVTDLTPYEIIFGKLGGVFYNSKEVVLLPLALCAYLWWRGHLSTENLLFLVLGLLVMFAFAAMLGLHAGMAYPNSRHAVSVSLGTLLFLFLGIATCMRMMLAFSESFQHQYLAFSGFIVGGGVGLFAALGVRNPSSAIAWASFLAPLATFYVITSFLIGSYFAAFLVTAATYGFATLAMLTPALAEFDVATGRSVPQEA